jgi:hypothetical protein
LQTAAVHDVLPFIVLQMDDSKDVCNSLQVCKVWRECLAECPGCINVVLVVGALHSLRKVARVAAWLGRYGKLVQRLDLGVSYAMREDPCDSMAIAESLIAQGCQLAAAQLRPLQTTIVCKEDLQTSAFLSSLPACSLTQLTLRDLRTSDDTICALARGLGHLLGLRELAMCSGYRFSGPAKVFPAACLSGLKQLSNLTCLKLRAGNHQWGAGLEQYLPVQLKSMTAYNLQAVSGDLRHLTCLTYLEVGAGELSLTQLPIQLQELLVTTGGECTVSLSNMTALASVSINDVPEGLVAGSSLPTVLPLLKLCSTPLPSNAATLLRGVVALCIQGIPTQPTAVWDQLGMLTNLQHIDLSFYTFDSAAAAAPVWGDLPSLHTLRVDHMECFDEIRGEYLATILRSLASARSLQKLEIDVFGLDLPCGVYMANLSRLQSLSLWSGAGKGDLLHLTKLSQLTELELRSDDIDDALCASLVCNLAQLKVLSLHNGTLGVDALVNIAHRLKSLQGLSLEFRDAATDDSLPYLLQLTQLTTLWLSPSALSRAGSSQLERALPMCRICLEGS